VRVLFVGFVVESYNTVAHCQQMGPRRDGEIVTRQRLQRTHRHQGM